MSAGPRVLALALVLALGVQGLSPWGPRTRRPEFSRLVQRMGIDSQGRYIPDGLSEKEWADIQKRELAERESKDFGAWGPRFNKVDAPFWAQPGSMFRPMTSLARTSTSKAVGGLGGLREKLAKAGPAAALAYVLLNIFWYGINVAWVVLFTAPKKLASSSEPGSIFVAAATRIVKVWGVVFLASQWTTGPRAVGALAISPFTSRVIIRASDWLRIESRWLVTGVLSLLLVTAFGSSMGLLFLNEVARMLR